MKRIYYAHPMSLYGTPQEARDIKTLEALGFEVVNPGSAQHQNTYRSGGYSGMGYWENLVDMCDALAFRAFIDGTIGAGVYAEICRAADNGKPVFELPRMLQKRQLTRAQTSDYLHELGQR